MGKVFAVLGSGMQGTALAYDIAKFAEPSKILMADWCMDVAKQAAWRVNDLVGSKACEPVEVDALNPPALQKLLADVDVLASCVPYWMHPKVAKVAIETKTNMIDLGGNTEITLETLSLDETAKKAGVTLVPDCGLAPGLVNNLGCYLIEQMDKPESVKLYCGVLPQHPVPPFNYKLTFNIEGLVAEYSSKAVVLRDGRIELVPTLDELERITVTQLGEMEAFTTSGGSSTAPYTFEGKIKNYEYKTIRFPGHCALMKMFSDYGFWGNEPVELRGCKVKPVDMFSKVFGDKLASIEDKDMCIVRAVGQGEKSGKPFKMQIDIFDREDEVTGFTSMERLTGFSAAIYAEAIAKGELDRGCLRYETAMSGEKFVERLQQRGIKLTIS